MVASLPCYGSENVDAQRGFGVFERSIAGLKVSAWPCSGVRVEQYRKGL